MADSREYLTRTKDIPALFVESDLVDPRLWSEAQFKNRIDAYFEALGARKAAGQVASRAGSTAASAAASR